jgi:hypothetical protein
MMNLAGGYGLSPGGRPNVQPGMSVLPITHSSYESVRAPEPRRGSGLHGALVSSRHAGENAVAGHQRHGIDGIADR